MNWKKCSLWASLALNLAVVGMECSSVLISFLENGGESARYYTEDSNLLALIACGLLAAGTIAALIKGGEVAHWMRILKYVAVCCLTLTFLVVVAILAPMEGLRGYRMFLLEGRSLYEHLLCPVAAFLSLVLFERPLPRVKGTLLWAALPSGLYAVVIIILNLTRVLVGPYPFLRIYQQPVAMSVLWSVLILGGALAIAWVIRLICLPRKGKTAGK